MPDKPKRAPVPIAPNAKRCAACGRPDGFVTWRGRTVSVSEYERGGQKLLLCIMCADGAASASE